MFDFKQEIKSKKLEIRNAINSLTGKQAVIDEYNELTQQIYTISDNLANDTPIKKTILKDMGRICEEKINKGSYGMFFISSYNPWGSTKSMTLKKIDEMKQLLVKIQSAGINIR